MTTTGQQFTMYAGDAAQPVITVWSDLKNSVPLDISGVNDIIVSLARDPTSTAVLTKKKTTAGVAFVTDGTNGQFYPKFIGTDTAALTGFYLMTSQLVDSGGNVSTVAIDRVQIGQLPVWTYSGDPANSPKDAIRYLVGDTVFTDQQVQDGEINFAIAQTSNQWLAAAMVCRALSARLSREADVSDRELRTSYSARARSYLRMAVQYEMRSDFLGGGMPYAGGISLSDKQANVSNTDNVPANFAIGMTDNTIPVGPVGVETEGEEGGVAIINVDH